MNNSTTTQRQILNIAETVERAKSTGYTISGYTLRRAIRSGLIPCRVVGRTYLIAWDNVVKWLMCDISGEIEEKQDFSGIRRIEVGDNH